MSKKKASLREITWDEQAEAIYIKVRDTKIKATVEAKVSIPGCHINIDHDENGQVVGFEILL